MMTSVIILLIGLGLFVLHKEGIWPHSFTLGFAIILAFGSIIASIEEQTSRIIKAHREEMLGQTQAITNEIMEIKRG